MKPHDIGKAYNQITHLWDTEGFNRNNGIDHHKRTIAVVKNKGKALDVGCGCTGRFIDLLLSEGFSPEGVDVISKTKTIINALAVALSAICSGHSQDLQRLLLVPGIGCQ